MGCEQGPSKELLGEAKWPRGDLCGHCWNTSKEEKPEAPKAWSSSCLGTTQGRFYSRMETDPDVTAEPLGEPGMHLHWDNSLYASHHPCWEKWGRCRQITKAFRRMETLPCEQGLQETQPSSLQRR